jgi:hypothetical protein
MELSLRKIVVIILLIVVITIFLLFFPKYLYALVKGIPSADETEKAFILTPEQGFDLIVELYENCFDSPKEECTCGGHFSKIKNYKTVIKGKRITLVPDKKQDEAYAHEFKTAISCYINDKKEIKETTYAIIDPIFIPQTPSLFKKGNRVCLVLEDYIKDVDAIRAINPC